MLAERGVIFLVQPEAVLIYELILGVTAVKLLQSVFCNEFVEHLVFCANEITPDIRRLDVKAIYRLPVFDGIEFAGGRDFKVSCDESLLHLGADFLIQQRDMQHVIIIQHFPADAELLGVESHSGDPATLAVAAVVHLP